MQSEDGITVRLCKKLKLLGELTFRTGNTKEMVVLNKEEIRVSILVLTALLFRLLPFGL
jgi:hypothetical protein